MRTLLHPFLPNGPGGDPALWIDVLDEEGAVLLDAGDLQAIPPRKLLRVERVVVTHAHMDHFAGFDRLLRVALGRDRPLKVTGPAGFLDRMRAKVGAYTWNLIENYPIRWVVEEIDGDTLRSCELSGAGGMQAVPQRDRPFDGTLHARRSYTIHADVLDHGIPVLGVALREIEHLAVDKDALTRLGLAPGPWLAQLKAHVRACGSREQPIRAGTLEGGFRDETCGALAQRILRRTPGQRLAYLTDLAWTPENRARAVKLAQGADLLVCEAAFLHEDAELARERRHLTARQAGELAREAGVRKLAPFHFSPRYHGREPELLAEAQDAFGGPLVELPRS